MKYLILFLFITNFLFGVEYVKMNGKETKFKKTSRYIAIKTDTIKTEKDIKAELNKISLVEEVKAITNKSFIIKFKNSINNKDFNEYEVMPSYNKNGGWPIVTNKRIIVHFKDFISQKVKEMILKNFSLKIIHTFDSGSFILSVEEDSFKIANKLFDLGLFDYSYPDYYILHERYFTPNDTLYSNQWHLNGAFTDGTGGVNAEKAWDITRGSSTIKIGVIDDGMDIYHEDLNVIDSYNFTGQGQAFVGNTGVIGDENAFHGTSVAGVAAGKGNNNKGVTGLCMNCSVIAAQLLTNTGVVYVSADVQAFEWIARRGADIINNSWGFSGENLNLNLRNENPELYNVIHTVATNGRNGKGCVVLFAAGNDSKEIYNYSLPGHPDVITIGAITYEDERSYYSNYGERVDIVAPSNGSNSYGIWSTDIMGQFGYSTGNYTDSFGGTSSATPLVSGLVGLILSQNSNLKSNRVKEILTLTAKKIEVLDELDYGSYSCKSRAGASYNNSGHSICMGYGKIDAYKSLRYVRDYDKCKTVSCSGFGECTVENNTAVCECINGYHTEGLNCVKDIDPCEKINCNNHGNCEIYKEKPICLCETGYNRVNGTTCIKDLCYEVECSGFGNCTEKENIITHKKEAVCECYMGYNQVGLECIEGDVCSSVFCSEKGYCDIFAGGAQCVCIVGYHADGPYCIENTEGDECNGVSCSGKGICKTKDDGKAYCDCEKNYKASALNCMPAPEKKGWCSYSDSSSNSNFLFLFLFLFAIIALKSHKKIL